MYYLKNFTTALLEIARHLTADLGETVDLIEGSVTLSVAEAIAFQAADLSERQERSIEEAIPDAVFEAFSFAALPGRAAQGTLLFLSPVPARDVIFIPAGTEAISDDEQTFRTTADAYIVPGAQSVSVPAVSAEVGTLGNAPALSVVIMATGVPGVQGVSNPAPFSGGTDPETRAQQSVRFLGFLAALDKSGKAGMTVAALGTAVGTDEITPDNVRVLDRDDDRSIMPAYFALLAYRRGGMPDELRAAVQATTEASRAGGTVALFEWTTGTPVNVQLDLDVPDVTAQVRAAELVKQAVGAYFAALGYGQKASYENVVTVAERAHPSIVEVAVLLNGAQADVPAGLRTRLELGTLDVQQVSA